MGIRRSMSAALAAALACGPIAAQEWTGPMFSSPVLAPRVDLIAADAYGSGAGVVVGVRPFAGTPGLRLRLGVADGRGTGPLEGSFSGDRSTVAYLAGLDFSAPIKSIEQGAVRASWVTGVGVAVNGPTQVSVPLGFSLGFNGERVRPYVTPRVLLQHRSGSRPTSFGADRDGFRTAAVVDWGVDVLLPRGGTLRAAVTTGSFQGIGIGFSF